MSQSRLTNPSSAQSLSASSPSSPTHSVEVTAPTRKRFAHAWAFGAVRLTLISFTVLLCYQLGPFGVHGLPAAGLGFLMAMVILLAELRMRRAEVSGLMGGAVGGILGLLASLLITLIVSRTVEPEPTKSFLEFTSFFALGYLGLVIGSSKAPQFRHVPLPESVELPGAEAGPMKLLDTSALIDGRIADICETHFLDGTLGVPRFVLHELQLVADSSDSLKRQRGRRGLEVLQRMQKMSWLEMRILEREFPGGVSVDQKLLELARESGSKIVTNDFNLNKVARVQGIAVLNVNELANAMKPAALPGESMRVLIVREGKESTQGVAYLEDGTMVVVDGARRFINRSIDIVVTSMHQTPAGKMIFGRLDDRADSSRISAAPLPTAEANGNGSATRAPSQRFDPPPPSAYTTRDPQ